MRFDDPQREARFRKEHLMSALVRQRALLIFGLFSSTAAGFLELRAGSGIKPEVARAMEFWRFAMLTPSVCLHFASTFHRSFARHGHAYNAFAAIIASWALGLLAWEQHLGDPQSNLTLMLLGTVNLCLIAATLATPMVFRWLVFSMTTSVAGLIVWFQFMLPADSSAEPLHLQASFLITWLTMLGLGWFREASERKAFAQKEQLDALNAELARLDTEKSEFMAIAAHDLRAPLANMRALAELLRDERLADPAKRKLAASNIHNEAGRMLVLVSDYLSSHEATHGQLPLQLTRLDLAEVAVETRARHEATAAAKQQQIEVVGASVWVNADRALLAQVVDNFMSNALKFSPVGSRVRIEIQVAESTQAGGGALARLAIIDDGPGIPASDQPALFKRFARLGNRPTAGETSSGLGLAVAKRLATAMGASVGFADGRGKDSAVFWIEFATI